jgi:hypothetical protein
MEENHQSSVLLLYLRFTRVFVYVPTSNTCVNSWYVGNWLTLWLSILSHILSNLSLAGSVHFERNFLKLHLPI